MSFAHAHSQGSLSQGQRRSSAPVKIPDAGVEARDVLARRSSAPDVPTAKDMGAAIAQFALQLESSPTRGSPRNSDCSVEDCKIPVPVEACSDEAQLRAFLAEHEGEINIEAAGSASGEVSRVTPLVHACQMGKPEVVQLLLAAGADAGRAVGTQRKTALHLLCLQDAKHTHEATLAMMLMLASAGGCVDAPDDSGLSPSHHCCASGLVEALRLLLDCGAAVDAQTTDGYGRTPAHIAAFKGQPKCLELCLERKANPLIQLAKRDGIELNLLSLACAGASAECVKLVLGTRAFDLTEPDVFKQAHTMLRRVAEDEARGAIMRLLDDEVALGSPTRQPRSSSAIGGMLYARLTRFGARGSGVLTAVETPPASPA